MRTAATAAAALTALVIAAAAVAVADPFAGSTSAAAGTTDNAYPTALATVRQGPLSSQVSDSGTLRYAARPDGTPYTIVNYASGTYTRLPAVGRVVRQGQVLYDVSGSPVVLLAGGVPAYRTLSEGDSGADVTELNADLVALGYATSAQLDPSSDYFSAETAYALERLQRKLGVDQTGTLALGQAVFLPAPVRIARVTATPGTGARPGMPLALATSDRHQVVVSLDAAQQSSVKVGDRALITLPDNTTTPGTVTRIGTVASSSGSGGGATLPVYITLRHPRAAGTLDQAPVQVQITTSGVANALIVPVDSLLALAGGGYAVETVNASGVHRLVAVQLGLFDDADGEVQVTGALTAGERIVVPAQ